MGAIIAVIVIFGIFFYFCSTTGDRYQSKTYAPPKPEEHYQRPQIKTYTVRFYNGRQLLRQITVDEGSFINDKDIPKMNGGKRYEFCYWTEDHRHPNDFNLCVYWDVDLYAVWKKRTVTIHREKQILPWYKWILRTDELWSAEVGGHHIELTPATHSYVVDGYKVPSITEIIDQFGEADYWGVDSHILDKAADAALDRINEIELYEVLGIPGESREWENYQILKKAFGLNPIQMNLMVAIFDKEGNPMAAGTLCSLLQNKDGSYGIMGIKRTRDYYAKNVKLQLNLYRIGLMQCSGKGVSTLDCLRLKDTLSEHHIVPVDEEEAMEFLEEHLPYCE